ncbi:P-loop containing nucleoside triphosphate hydrolase protein [Fimicolochytrium jonesii]|uniref:P-loop containing nucleoside triphosphate hydrolase protein n=1 Tax=Fimicolochytrium jonesii TaxID=1396493 RepID=UPI0022FE3291|nr:P-loop containing nucleoside triphosphate hydrolase protein [Fimicolochytrium jonesii]KAI8821178.1 P-loop containing nucleoside triphosphate hydrolase protein [Fimicolochytrium jonesii]
MEWCSDPEKLGPVSELRPADFSACFHDYILTLSPLALAALCVVFGLFRTAKSNNSDAGKTRPSRLGTALMALSAAAALACSVVLLINPSGASTVAALAITILVSIVLVAQLIDFSRSRPARVSIVCFWIWLAFATIAKLRSLALADLTSSSHFTWNLGVLISSVLWLLFEELLSRKTADGEDANPLDRAGLLTYLTFGFIWSKLRDSHKYKLAQDDVWRIPYEESTIRGHDRLTAALSVSATSGKGKLTNVSFCLALIKSQLPMVIGAIGLKVLASILILVQPLLLDTLINYVSSHNTDPTAGAVTTPQPRSTGFLIAIGMLLLGLVAAIMNVWGSQLSWLLYYRWKISTASLAFRKSLRLSPSSRVENNTGNVSNLLSNDAMEVGFLAANIPEIVAAVIQVVFGIALIWVQLGLSTLSVIGFIILLGPLQVWNANFIEKWSDLQFEVMDTRLSLTTEIVNGMKIIKMYAWESFFAQKLQAFRKTELHHLYIRRIGEIFGVLLGNLPPVIMFVAALGISTAVEKKPLDVNNIFVSLALFNLLKGPLVELSMSLPGVAVSWACVKRVVVFLNEGEIDDYVDRNSGKPGSIHIKAGRFTWGAPEKDAEDEGEAASSKDDQAKGTAVANLIDISVDVAPGEFIGLAGSVGSGKSSLLCALLGQMEKIVGNIAVNGSVVYVSQKPWIFQGTVRENILIGRPYEAEHYRRVVEACALARDLDHMTAGDQTEIGERGVNLSGGQRARVSLARALYGHDADIYLFDDVLSAVDRHVAKHIFENVLGSKGILANKTRVLATHAVHFLDGADRTLVMKDGSIIASGSYEDLLADNMISEASMEVNSVSESDNDNETLDPRRAAKGDSNAGLGSEEDEQESIANVDRIDGEKAKMIEEEETESGKVSWGVVMMYFRACSFALLAAFFLGLVVSEGVNLGSRYWLLYWNDNPSSHSLAFYFSIYATWVVGYVILYPWAGALFLCFMGVRAGRVLHEDLLARILKMPWTFYSVTPVGRIMTRFSNNLAAVDCGLPDAFYDMIFALANVVVNLLPTVISMPTFLIVILVAGILCYALMYLYIPASVAYLRIKSNCDAFIWSHVDETLNGLDSVTAYRLDVIAAERNAFVMDNQQAALIMFYWANRWFSLWITIVSTLVVFASAIFAVLSVESMSPSVVALAVSTILAIMQEVAIMMTKLGYLQTQLVDAERLKQYLDLPIEQDVPADAQRVLPQSWPQNGRIEFKNVNMRYRSGLDLVLKRLSFTIEAGQKVGIVGRTGAGKSSLALALMRLVDICPPSSTSKFDEERGDEAALEGGSITIDGVDIATVPLATLRQRLSIIPQEAFLFTGTVRENLDPFGNSTDHAIWAALDKVGLKPFVQGLSDAAAENSNAPASGTGLDAAVTESGSNFSVGQKQLLCVARAILRDSRVIVLDEATASVDNNADAAVQRAIATQFAGRTVITIAHRVNTLMSYDRIIVMDAGRVVESDSPAALLANPASLFYALVHEAGTVDA